MSSVLLVWMMMGASWLQAAAQDSAEPAPTATAPAGGPLRPAGEDRKPPAASRPAEPLGDFEFERGELDDLRLLAMDVPTVSTATRHEGNASLAPYAVSVVTAEDIRRSGARSVPDALRLVPGVDVAELGYGNAAVSPRGLHGFFANQTLILVDGRQIVDSLMAGAVWASWPFELEDIERIEVVRGPGGVVWGSNTSNGIINIITKDPADQRGLTITGGGGSRGTQKEHLGYAFSAGKLRMRLSGEYEGSDGFAVGGSPISHLDDDYQIARSNLSAIYEATPKDTFRLAGGNGTVDGLSSVPAMARLFSSRHAESQASYLMGQWEHRISEDNRFTITGFVNDYHACPGMTVVDYRYQQLALQISHTFKLDRHVITWGVDNRVDLVDASNCDPPALRKDFVSTDITGVYVQDEWQIAPKWKLNLGAREDYDSYGGFQPSGRIALARELTANSLAYGAVSRAFSMPPGGLRFANAAMSRGVAQMTAQRDIDPATMMAYEVGYKGRPLKPLQLSADLYAHNITDVRGMVPRLGPPGLINVDIENVGDLWLYGAEFEARYTVNPKLTLLGNYTFERCDANLELPLRYADMMNPPGHKFMVGAQYNLTDDLHLSAYTYYVGGVSAFDTNRFVAARRIPPYVRLDLRAEYEFWQRRASLAVGVRNLIDPNHPEGGSIFLNSAEVPRMVYAEMRIKLD